MQEIRCAMRRKMNNSKGVKKASPSAKACNIVQHLAHVSSPVLGVFHNSQTSEIIEEWCPEADLNRHARFHEAQDFKSCILISFRYLLSLHNLNFTKLILRQFYTILRPTLQHSATVSVAHNYSSCLHKYTFTHRKHLGGDHAIQRSAAS